MFARKDFSGIKVIVFLEHTFDISDTADAVWRFANNVDPKRDHILVEDESGVSHLSMDGTRKTKEFDGFQRDWPNILASDDRTIERIDEIWDKLGLGKFIESPSKNTENIFTKVVLWQSELFLYGLCEVLTTSLKSSIQNFSPAGL